jgi:hypothetical protein
VILSHKAFCIMVRFMILGVFVNNIVVNIRNQPGQKH